MTLILVVLELMSCFGLVDKIIHSYELLGMYIIHSSLTYSNEGLDCTLLIIYSCNRVFQPVVNDFFFSLVFIFLSSGLIGRCWSVVSVQINLLSI